MQLKKILLPGIALFCFSFTCSAQDAESFNVFSQKKDAAPYRGMKFRMHAAVKTESADKSGEAFLWVRVDNTNGKVGFFDNMYKRPVTSDQWKVYTITGVVDTNAKFLNTGGIYMHNGDFSFDDFVLEVQDSTGNWKNILTDNAGFEADTLSPWKIMKKLKTFSSTVVTGGAFEGKKYMKATGSGIAKAYGNNSDAGHHVKANGISIYYEDYGSGDPLLLLHGNSQSIDAFSKQIPELSKHYHVIAVDTRGHGKTEIKGERYSYDLFAKDMNALLDKLNIDSANIVGWSDGGNTGLIMAMKYPKKVKKLITTGAVIFCDSTVVSQELIDQLNFGIEELKNAKSEEDLNDLKRTKLLKEEPNYKFADLRVIKCPVLIMAGEKDMIKYDHTKGIADAIPKGELYIAPKVSHYFPQENPKLFNEKVLEFLQRQ